MTAARLVVMILTISTASVYAENTKKTVPDSVRGAELIALDDAWIDAEVRGDRSALERILHEDFVATLASGRTVDRSSFIDAVLANPPAPFRVAHELIRVHADTALVIDVSESGKTKFTWIAIRRDGEWRVISETFSRVGSP